MSTLLSVRNLVKRYGAQEIVKRVSFEVKKGEVVALVGPSGAGKSTVLRCINWLAPFDEGEIDLAGHLLRPGMRFTEKRVRDTRRDAGMVFQDFQLFPHLTALDNVALGPRHVLHVPAADARARAEKILERVHLKDRMRHYPAQLSGGQRQRVGIARALAMEPKVLLLDEPTSALDPMLKAEVAEVILELKREGMTMLLVTHEHDLARAAADRVLQMKSGAIEAEVSPAQLA